MRYLLDHGTLAFSILAYAAWPAYWPSPEAVIVGYLRWVWL